MIKRLIALGLTAAMLLPVQIVQAQEFKKISAFDFLLEYEDMIGQSVQIEDCIAAAVDINSFLCPVRTETGRIGSISVRLKDVPKNQLVYGLKKCAGLMSEEKACGVTVKGIVDQRFNKDGFIKAQQLEWHAEK